VNGKPAIRNKTWAALNVGDAASLERTCSAHWRREGRAFGDEPTVAKAAE
jgi:hypothetical protein